MDPSKRDDTQQEENLHGNAHSDEGHHHETRPRMVLVFPQLGYGGGGLGGSGMQGGGETRNKDGTDASRKT